MAPVLTVENKKYIPAGQVGKHFGYTRDYILTLAREGKIDGRKIGHRWYVNLDSAKAFFETAKIEREERKQVIREVRREELRAHTIVEGKTVKHSRLVEVFAISVLGLVIGVAGLVSTGVPGQQAATSETGSATFFLKNLAISLYNLVSPQPFVTETVAPVAAAPVQGQAVASSTTISRVEYQPQATKTVHTSLVVAPDEVLTTTRVESIRDSFSDDVSVSLDPENPDTGIIIPHFKDRDGEAYRYLMVPVNDDTPQ